MTENYMFITMIMIAIVIGLAVGGLGVIINQKMQQIDECNQLKEQQLYETKANALRTESMDYEQEVYDYEAKCYF